MNDDEAHEAMGAMLHRGEVDMRQAQADLAHERACVYACTMFPDTTLDQVKGIIAAYKEALGASSS